MTKLFRSIYFIHAAPFKCNSAPGFYVAYPLNTLTRCLSAKVLNMHRINQTYFFTVLCYVL